MRSEDIGSQERFRLENRTVDVGFCGKVDDRVDPVADRIGNRDGVADVAADESVTRIAVDLAQVCDISGVRDRVEVNDPYGRPFLQHQTDEGGPDKS